jgi:hypothetical protein
VPTLNTGADKNSPQDHPEVAALRSVVLVSMVATVAVSTIVYVGRVAIDQIAPAAIATIGAVAVAAITAIGVVLRRRTRRSARA